MRRVHLFEFEDQAWFPKILRDALTGFLRVAARVAGQGRAIAPMLAEVLREQNERRIVDLCSGGGGPLVTALEGLRAEGLDVEITFTDLYPSAEHAGMLEDFGPHVRFESESVDATRVPARLAGLRTLSNGLHHFRPEAARRILAAAARDGAPIAVFEFAGRRPALLLGMLFSPISAALFVPFIRPFRWQWIPLTYLVPIVPLLVLWDGVVSCLRVYDERELLELVDGVADPQVYRFRVQPFRVPMLPVAFEALIGAPVRGSGALQAEGGIS